jgi:hypothetical protein
VTLGCHRRNADLFLKTVCVSLALLPRKKIYPSHYLRILQKIRVIPGTRKNLRKNFHLNRMKIWPLFVLAKTAVIHEVLPGVLTLHRFPLYVLCVCVVTAGGNRRSCVSHGDRRRSLRGGRRSNTQDTQKPFKSLTSVKSACRGWLKLVGVRVRVHSRLAFVFTSRIHAVCSTPFSWLRQEARAIRKEDWVGGI